MKGNHETCADCSEFPCGRFDRWFDADSFVTHQKCLPNIQKIKYRALKGAVLLSKSADRGVDSPRPEGPRYAADFVIKTALLHK
jgi:hypothetical protein